MNAAATAPVLNQMDEQQGTIKSITDSLGDFFRHLVPGVLALSLAILTRQDWTEGALTRLRDNTIGTNTLIVVAIVVTAVGNVWFVAHRYLLHQLVDFIFWFCRIPGTPQRGPKHPTSPDTGGASTTKSSEPLHSASTDLAAGIASHTHLYFTSTGQGLAALRQHVRLRSSGVVLMYMTAEALFVANCYANDDSPLSKHAGLTWAFGAVIFLAALYQNYVVRLLEGRVRTPSTSQTTGSAS